MRLAYKYAILFVALITASACTHDRRLHFSKMALALDDERATNLLKKCKHEDYRVFGNFALLSDSCSDTTSSSVRTFESAFEPVNTFCLTGFAERPDMLEGALENVHLADTRVNGLRNMTIDELRDPALICYVVKGEAVQFK